MESLMSPSAASGRLGGRVGIMPLWVQRRGARPAGRCMRSSCARPLAVLVLAACAVASACSAARATAFASAGTGCPMQARRGLGLRRAGRPSCPQGFRRSSPSAGRGRTPPRGARVQMGSSELDAGGGEARAKEGEVEPKAAEETAAAKAPAKEPKGKEDEVEEDRLPYIILAVCAIIAIIGLAVLITQGTSTPLFVLVVLLVAITGGTSLALGGLVLVQKLTEMQRAKEEEAAAEAERS
uniref:Uncharacterized protein n=1 Tax=Alexandrium catenella TaxID=2925 RepID=A0A7S1QBB1_ALECA